MSTVIRKSIPYGDRDLVIETGAIARQADGAVMVSLGDTVSLVYWRHPEPRKGIPEGFARLSVGLEDADDIIADLDQALTKADQ